MHRSRVCLTLAAQELAQGSFALVPIACYLLLGLVNWLVLLSPAVGKGFNVPVVSIIALDDIVNYVKSRDDMRDKLEQMKAYRAPGGCRAYRHSACLQSLGVPSRRPAPSREEIGNTQ
jgi:hypothetical protein